VKLVPGFRFKETMRGSFHRLDAPAEDHAIEIALTVETSDVRQFARDKTWTIRGTLDAEGIATRAAVDGTIEMRLFDERRLPYRCRFTGDDGAQYELRGQKELVPIAPFDSLTVLPASIYGANAKEMARAVLRFDARNELRSFLKSFRLAFA
jgi:hypothetical protein